MKKIGIVTLNGYYNFGNRLQNYALTKILEKMNYEVETIWSGDELNLKANIQYLIIRFFPYNNKWKRERKFYEFTRKYIKRVNYSTKIVSNFDIFVAGSDQVWNYDSVKNNINYLIPFATNQKVISYAASFGNSDMPEIYAQIYNKYLTNYDFISVRESIGKKIINNELDINKNVEVVIDPTLLLDKNEWDEISLPPAKEINKKYILCYFLGDLENNYALAIQKYAKDENLKIINVLNPNDDYYISGPGEFIYLIKNAELICTDSFHSSVFSFIYNKPFVIFKRKGEYEKMYSRLENFINTFKLKNREFDGSIINSDNINNDYSKSYVILENERKKAIEFLNNSLK